jgi:hypothetical protein
VLEARDHHRCIAINFNIIVPMQHWLWDKGDENCRIALRFGDLKLGFWKEDVGKFTLHELVNNVWFA